MPPRRSKRKADEDAKTEGTQTASDATVIANNAAAATAVATAAPISTAVPTMVPIAGIAIANNTSSITTVTTQENHKRLKPVSLASGAAVASAVASTVSVAVPVAVETDADKLAKLERLGVLSKKLYDVSFPNIVGQREALSCLRLYMSLMTRVVPATYLSCPSAKALQAILMVGPHLSGKTLAWKRIAETLGASDSVVQIHELKAPFSNQSYDYRLTLKPYLDKGPLVVLLDSAHLLPFGTSIALHHALIETVNESTYPVFFVVIACELPSGFDDDVKSKTSKWHVPHEWIELLRSRVVRFKTIDRSIVPELVESLRTSILGENDSLLYQKMPLVTDKPKMTREITTLLDRLPPYYQDVRSFTCRTTDLLNVVLDTSFGTPDLYTAMIAMWSQPKPHKVATAVTPAISIKSSVVTSPTPPSTPVAKPPVTKKDKKEMDHLVLPPATGTVTSTKHRSRSRSHDRGHHHHHHHSHHKTPHAPIHRSRSPTTTSMMSDETPARSRSPKSSSPQDKSPERERSRSPAGHKHRHHHHHASDDTKKDSIETSRKVEQSMLTDGIDLVNDDLDQHVERIYRLASNELKPSREVIKKLITRLEKCDTTSDTGGGKTQDKRHEHLLAAKGVHKLLADDEYHFTDAMWNHCVTVAQPMYMYGKGNDKSKIKLPASFSRVPQKVWATQMLTNERKVGIRALNDNDHVSKPLSTDEHKKALTTLAEALRAVPKTADCKSDVKLSWLLNHDSVSSVLATKVYSVRDLSLCLIQECKEWLGISSDKKIVGLSPDSLRKIGWLVQGVPNKVLIRDSKYVKPKSVPTTTTTTTTTTTVMGTPSTILDQINGGATPSVIPTKTKPPSQQPSATVSAVTSLVMAAAAAVPPTASALVKPKPLALTTTAFTASPPSSSSSSI